MESGATIDETGQYRYNLWRSWDQSGKKLVFVMLNPSTADAIENDPTIRRCIAFAKALEFASLEVVNLFAYRASSPNKLKSAQDPVGPENDTFLRQAANSSSKLILAWGNHGRLYRRNQQVLSLLSGLSDMLCLGITDRSQPRHPLYVKGDFRPVPFPSATKSD